MAKLALLVNWKYIHIVNEDWYYVKMTVTRVDLLCVYMMVLNVIEDLESILTTSNLGITTSTTNQKQERRLTRNHKDIHCTNLHTL